MVKRAGKAVPLLLLLAAGVIACAPEDPAFWQLEDGTPLAELDGGTAVVLVVDPSDPFSCWRSLAPWQEWRKETGRAYHVVLSRPATDLEMSRLRTIGVNRAPVLKRGTLDPAHTPVELRFADSQTRFYAYRVRVPESPLLESLRRREAELSEPAPLSDPQSLLTGGT